MINKKRTKSNSSHAKSEQNISVHNKLFIDSKVRNLKMKENKENHKFDGLRSTSNDRRKNFFFPIISESSKRILKKRLSKSGSK